MPPKIKITKDEIIDTSIEIVRQSGAEALNARNIAKSLDISTQPIFSNFKSMEELRTEIINKAYLIYQKYLQAEIDKRIFPIFKSMGMGYIIFAKEEKELFKLLFMRNRTNEIITDDTQTLEVIKKITGFSDEIAKLLQLETWAFVHGIATMLATGYQELDYEIISLMLTDIYTSLKTKYENAEK